MADTRELERRLAAESTKRSGTACRTEEQFDLKEMLSEATAAARKALEWAVRKCEERATQPARAIDFTEMLRKELTDG